MDVKKFLFDCGPTVIPLLGASVIGLTVSLERGFYWFIHWCRRNEGVRRRLFTGDTRLGNCKDPVARVLKDYMDCPDDPSIAKSEAEKLVRDSMNNLKILNWIATISTSLGLFGTVVGIAETLSDIQNQSKLVAGLSVAINTTILGLIIFLPTFSFSCWFAARSQALKLELKDLFIEAQRAMQLRRSAPSAAAPIALVGAPRRS